jgi:hypothetical protein
MTSTSKGRGSDPRAALAEVKAHMFPDGSYYDRPDEFIGEADAEIAALAERGVLLVPKRLVDRIVEQAGDNGSDLKLFKAIDELAALSGEVTTP